MFINLGDTEQDDEKALDQLRDPRSGSYWMTLKDGISKLVNLLFEEKKNARRSVEESNRLRKNGSGENDLQQISFLLQHKFVNLLFLIKASTQQEPDSHHSFLPFFLLSVLLFVLLSVLPSVLPSFRPFLSQP